MNRVFVRIGCLVTIAALLSGASLTFADTAEEKMPRGAIQPALLGGFDVEPDLQFGLFVDGYLRLTKVVSLGLRIGLINAFDTEEGIRYLPQIPISLLVAFDVPIRTGRVLVPILMGSGVSLMPADEDEMFIELFTITTGAKVRLSKNIWISLLGGCRFLRFYHFEYGMDLPYVDFHFLVGPYIRF